MAQLKVDESREMDSASRRTFRKVSGQLDALNASVGAGRKNLLDNGAHVINQRVSQQTGVASDSGQRTVDRWLPRNNALGTYTYRQVADGPAASGFVLCHEMLCTTADAAPAAGDFLIYQHGIEGFNLQHLLWGTSAAKPLTLSFWVKSNVAGYVGNVELQNNGAATRGILAQYKIAAANTWERKTMTFPGDAGQGLTNDSSGRLFLAFWLGSGSTFAGGTLQTAWGTLVAANRAVGVTNLSATINNTIKFTGVQLEVGTKDTAFEFLDFQTELARCQRYYEKSYNYDHALGTPTTTGAMTAFVVDTSITTRMTPTNGSFTVTKRGIPTVAFYALDGTVGSLTLYNGATKVTAATNSPSDRQVEGAYLSMGAGGVAGTFYLGHWTATADI